MNKSEQEMAAKRVDLYVLGFEDERSRVKSMLCAEAGKYDPAESGVRTLPNICETFAWFIEAIGANKVGGPRYARWSMRHQMLLIKKKEFKIRKTGEYMDRRPALAKIQIDIDACSVVLCFVEAIVASECGE